MCVWESLRIVEVGGSQGGVECHGNAERDENKKGVGGPFQYDIEAKAVKRKMFFFP